MSLELAIQDNTRAINALIEILRNQAANPVPVELSAGAAAIIEPDPPKAKKAKKEAGKTEAPLEQTAPSPDTGATSASVTEAAAAPAVSYADLQRAVLAFIGKHGKPAALAIAHEYGLDSFKSADPSQYAELKAVVEAAL